MAKTSTTRLPEIVNEHEQDILAEWVAVQKESLATRRDLMNESEL